MNEHITEAYKKLNEEIDKKIEYGEYPSITFNAIPSYIHKSHADNEPCSICDEYLKC